MTKKNRLSREKSAYLQKASSQKIDWHPWSDEAFAIAKKEDKPLFLSSGAVWCHWCHVMAKESFYDDDVAGLLNSHFISIKLDRDERPDIDRRYQMAVSAMGQGGGWPLSVFLTPDKKPFYGGTYFPPEDKMGRPGLKKILLAVIKLYREKPDTVSEYTSNIMKLLKVSPSGQGEIDGSYIENAVKKILADFDVENGGFGTAPKFPMPGATEFIINRYFFTESDSLKFNLIKTLEAMAKGGFYDQLAGGFHRYSTDPSWIIPHFEKMADDNAWLLRNYLYAYGVTGNKLFRQIAEETVRFIIDVLADPDGGFYASQDADVTPDDEGGYFTWTDEEIRSLLTDEEYEVISLHLMHEAGSMHHDKSRKVLSVVLNPEKIAEKTGKALNKVAALIEQGKGKLLTDRLKRETPFIDKALYTSINGMIISSLLLASRLLNDESLKATALRSLDRIMGIRFIDGELYHSEKVRALLDDYVYLIHSLASAYEITGHDAYIKRAVELMEICTNKLWDKDDGGFFDSEDHALGIKIKGVEDIPHPSANSICIILLIKLHNITGDNTYMRYAERSLKTFSTRANDMGTSAGYYFCALDAYLNTLKLSLYAAPDSDLASQAREGFHPYMSIVYEEDMRYIIPCIGKTCYKPVKSREDIKYFIESKEYLLKT